MNQVITITDRAVSKITELLEERGNVGLLITIGCGVGCSSSIDYALSYVANVASHMCTIEARGIKFFYAPEIELIIRGINIDVAGDDDECGFVVTNKYHKPCQNCTCGCGRS
ncbi:MAG: hypothetical protein LBD43_02120 [Holosporales bacterium]|nr:hypothetical protein [Holosporales bacterium]